MIVSSIRAESQIWPVCDVNVYLNGRRLEACVFADDKLGYVDILVKDANGNWVINYDEIKGERLYGRVEIRVGDDV